MFNKSAYVLKVNHFYSNLVTVSFFSEKKSYILMISEQQFNRLYFNSTMFFYSSFQHLTSCTSSTNLISLD